MSAALDRTGVHQRAASVQETVHGLVLGAASLPTEAPRRPMIGVDPPRGETWQLRLDLAAHTRKPVPAIERLEPQVAPDHHVLAVATLVRTRPHPRRKAIGGRASEEKALVLDMRVTEA